MKNTAVAYVRVSTNDQANEGVSLDAQIASVKAYAMLKGLDLVEIIVEAGVSGGKSLADRSGGEKLLSLIKKRKVVAVLATKLDRLFRNAADCLATTKSWDDNGVALHLIDLGGSSLDTSSAVGRLFLTMLAGTAEMERSLIAERTSSALKHKSSKGEKVSSIAPLGFSFEGDRVVENATEQEAIRKIKSLHAAGYGAVRIARIMNRNGIPSRGRCWYVSSVQTALAA
jgi:site-specific DNA recombinase